LERDDLETLIGTLGTVDHRGVDWRNVRWTAYLIHQHLRYDYPGEVHDLRQRLVIVPPAHYGGQRLVTHKLEVSAPGSAIVESRDPFGNLVLSLHVERIERRIDFTAWIVVEREATEQPVGVAGTTYADLAFRQPSPLTMPDPALLAAATELHAQGGDGLALARRINSWVYGQMRYAHGLTGVRTTAAEAFALRQGVCQDYAHVMLALCRACDLPARYVSGHLLGEGGTHAWVEVLLPDPAGADYVAWPFDPTHGNEPGLNYITIAVGRDYADVAPTSGTFRAPYGGQLSASKRAGLTALEYFGAGDLPHPPSPSPPPPLRLRR
jgi:transglutaminase-like putative cysteine protease